MSGSVFFSWQSDPDPFVFRKIVSGSGFFLSSWIWIPLFLEKLCLDPCFFLDSWIRIPLFLKRLCPDPCIFLAVGSGSSFFKVGYRAWFSGGSGPDSSHYHPDSIPWTRGPFSWPGKEKVLDSVLRIRVANTRILIRLSRNNLI